jgi:hypothetical protein
VIHHFSTQARRLHAVKELCRILKPGGSVMIYVWAMEQKLRNFKSQDVLVPLEKTSLLTRRTRRTNDLLFFLMFLSSHTQLEKTLDWINRKKIFIFEDR